MDRLNPELPERGAADAVEQLVRLRPPGAEVRNNREVWNLLRDGAKVEVRSSDGQQADGDGPVHRLGRPRGERLAGGPPVQVDGELYKTRADIVGFVNGIPLVFVELKAPQVDHKHAYDDNLTHYRRRSRSCSGSTG